MVKTIKAWSFGVIFFAIYAISGILVLTYANGYNIVEGCNLEGCELQQTGGVFIDFENNNIENAQILINRIPLKINKLPLKLSWFIPGEYTLTVTKVGFHTWEKTFRLEKGMIKSFRDITLRPIIFSPTKLRKFTSTNDDKLTIKNSYELWGKKNNSEKYFISQYTKTLDKALFLNSTNIIILSDSSVYIIDSTGENKIFVTDNAKDISTKNNNIQVKTYQGQLIEYKL